MWRGNGVQRYHGNFWREMSHIFFETYSLKTKKKLEQIRGEWEGSKITFFEKCIVSETVDLIIYKQIRIWIVYPHQCRIIVIIYFQKLFRERKKKYYKRI